MIYLIIFLRKKFRKTKHKKLEKGEIEITANILEIEVLNDYVVIITEKERINFNLESLEQINIKKLDSVSIQL